MCEYQNIKATSGTLVNCQPHGDKKTPPLSVSMLSWKIVCLKAWQKLDYCNISGQYLDKITAIIM